MPLDFSKFRKNFRKKYITHQISTWGHQDFDSVGPSEGGVCRGMCLDWIRRILHGKRQVHEDPTKKKKRQAKQINTHELFNSATRDHRKFLQKELDELTSLQLDSWSEMLRSGQGLISLDPNQGQTETFNKLNTKFKKSSHENEVWTKEVEKFSSKHAIDSEQFISHNMPEVYSKFRALWKSANKNKGDFEAIQIKPESVVSPGVISGTFLWEKLVFPCVSNMKKGTCVMLQCGKKAQGHAIALHVSLGGVYYFFDPNLGEYCFDPGKDEQKIFQAFLIELWDGVYGSEDLAYDWAGLVIFEVDLEKNLKARNYDPLRQKAEEKVCLIM